VDREFGTGALKITPGHDPNDYAIGKKFGLPIINILNKDATLNENAGDYRYMTIIIEGHQTGGFSVLTNLLALMVCRLLYAVICCVVR
jgi:hypothetical protein